MQNDFCLQEAFAESFSNVTALAVAVWKASAHSLNQLEGVSMMALQDPKPSLPKSHPRFLIEVSRNRRPKVVPDMF